jgi:hypothetical protein
LNHASWAKGVTCLPICYARPPFRLGEQMPRFRVLRQQDAFVQYEAEVEADTPQAAVDQAYTNPSQFRWEHTNVAEYDACRVVALDEDGDEIETAVRGKF